MILSIDGLAVRSESTHREVGRRSTTPTLIIQGIRDVYGGIEVLEDYRLSPSVSLEFFDGGHEFVASARQCAHIPQLVHAFAREGWRL